MKMLQELNAKGSSVFPFVIEDGAFRISLSRVSKFTPMAYVKMSSRYLSSTTPKAAEEELRSILDKLGTLTASAHVSRIDLCADFVSHENMESWVVGRGSRVVKTLPPMRSMKSLPAGQSVWVGILPAVCITSCWKSSPVAAPIFFRSGKQRAVSLKNPFGASSFN